MNNNEDNNSPVINKFTIIQSTPEPFAQAAQFLKYAILHLILKLCTILGSVVYLYILSKIKRGKRIFIK